MISERERKDLKASGPVAGFCKLVPLETSAICRLIFLFVYFFGLVCWVGTLTFGTVIFFLTTKLLLAFDKKILIVPQNKK